MSTIQINAMTSSDLAVGLLRTKYDIEQIFSIDDGNVQYCLKDVEQALYASYEFCDTRFWPDFQHVYSFAEFVELKKRAPYSTFSMGFKFDVFGAISVLFRIDACLENPEMSWLIVKLAFPHNLLNDLEVSNILSHFLDTRDYFHLCDILKRDFPHVCGIFVKLECSTKEFELAEMPSEFRACNTHFNMAFYLPCHNSGKNGETCNCTSHSQFFAPVVGSIEDYEFTRCEADDAEVLGVVKKAKTRCLKDGR